MAEGWPKKRRILGTKVKRLDGPDKATGRAKYSYDVNRPGMLHGAILRSPHAHAKIKSLDTTAARKMPGVKAVLVIGVAKDVTLTTVAAAAGTLTYQSKPGKDEEEGRVRVTPAVTLIKDNKPAKLADL